ncbi:MAG: pyrroline-5-carboxylate reductase [Acidiphilium sp. 37-67-22]|nr:MAG: pyrroline-5-carboxylate reductase [Acidiphilium sp. 37-67-22]
MTDAALPDLLLLGGGKMGSAMLAGWRERGISRVVVVDPGRVVVVDPGAEAQALAGDGVVVVDSPAAIPDGFAPQAVILAVKPQMAGAAVDGLARFAGGAVIVSIMAGLTIGWLQARFPGAAIVRAMPNTPAAVRQGITVAVAGPGVAPARRALAEALLGAVGQVAMVDDEALLDPVTAVSGGGPAYVFLLVELLEEAALDQGIPPDLARVLARQTVIGSAALLAASDQPADALRRAVMRQAIAAATARSRELAAG